MVNNQSLAGITYHEREPLESKGEPSNPFKTAALMLGSALMGGVAFAIWNRRQIAKIHEQPWNGSRPPPLADDDGIY